MTQSFIFDRLIKNNAGLLLPGKRRREGDESADFQRQSPLIFEKFKPMHLHRYVEKENSSQVSFDSLRAAPS